MTPNIFHVLAAIPGELRERNRDRDITQNLSMLLSPDPSASMKVKQHWRESPAADVFACEVLEGLSLSLIWTIRAAAFLNVPISGIA